MVSRLKKTKPVALIFTSICLVLSFVHAAIFIVVHADHDCTGEACHVCASLKCAKDTLKRLVAALPLISVVSPSCVSFFVLYGFFEKYYVNWESTPVQARVRLND
ncbi:MAG: hypothetical protein LBT31_10430 [Synergistaceae bacterium]|jgi:hypothetical protein|nr:hypothetical protein [Synergistaceae bacterium]